MTAHSFPPDAKAPGVDYFTVPGADLRMFRCGSHDLTLSTRGCADRWTRAQDLTESWDRNREEDTSTLSTCARCPIGAAHAGRESVHYMPAYASPRCPRCGFARRMIGGRVCISCYNRELELRRGRNTRGNRPTNLPPVVEVPIRYAVDGASVAEPRMTPVAVVHATRVRTGNKDKRGKPIYEPEPHVRGGTIEAAWQVLRVRRGLVDFLPMGLIPDVARQQELPFP